MASLVAGALAELAADDALGRPSYEGNDRICQKLQRLRKAIIEDPGTRAVGLRDELSKALCTMSTEPLSPPIRRQLGLCMTTLGDVEPRAVLPLVDLLLSSIGETKKSGESKVKVLPAGQITVLLCLRDVWMKHGRHCTSRVEELMTVAKGLWRPTSPPDVRISAIAVAQAALESSPLRGVQLSTHLALVKPLIVDPLPALRRGGTRLCICMVQADTSLAADILPSIFKVLENPEPFDAHVLLGALMATLASGSAPGKLEKSTSSLKSFRRSTKGSTVAGVDGVHTFMASIFSKEKCPEHVRVNVARVYACCLRELRKHKSEHDILVEFIPRVLGLAVTQNKNSAREEARIKQACVSYILRVGISRELTESGQELVVNTLVTDITERRNVAHMHIALSCAVQELTSTLIDLGGNFQPTDEMRELILSQLQAPYTPLRLAAGTCLRSFAVSSPDQLTAVIRHCASLIRRLTDGHNNPPTAGSGAAPIVGDAVSHTLHGASHCIASAMMAAPAGTLGLPIDVLDECMSLADRVVKFAWTAKSTVNGRNAGQDEDAVYSKGAVMSGGWAIVCASLRMGIEWIEGHIPLLMQMWTSALINPPVDCNTPKLTEADLQCWVESTCGALAALQVCVCVCVRVCRTYGGGLAMLG
jgi:hypothetical protein